MPRRILLNPEPSEGGGTPAPTPPAGAASLPVPPVVPPPDPNPALLARLAEAERKAAEFEAAERQRAESARKAEEEKLAAKGQYEEIIRARDAALEAERAKTAAIHERTQAAERTRELALALASGPKLVEGAADQLMQLWANRFDVVPEGEGWKVQTKDFKSPRQFAAEMLATPQYSHFVAAEARGGGGPSGGGQGLPSPVPGESAPKLTAGELTLLAMKEQMEEKKKKDPLGGYTLGSGNRAFVRN
jgi:hypothetical protein